MNELENVKNEAVTADPLTFLRRLEPVAYQAAYYIVQDEKLAVEITQSSLLDAYNSMEQFDRCDQQEWQVMMKRFTMRHALPVIERFCTSVTSLRE